MGNPLEIKNWLAATAGKSPFASNVFTRESLLEFVNKLYECGAEEVTVDGVTLWPGKEDESYADTLYIRINGERLVESDLLVHLFRYPPDEFSIEREFTGEPTIRFHPSKPFVSKTAARILTLRLWWD